VHSIVEIRATETGEQNEHRSFYICTYVHMYIDNYARFRQDIKISFVCLFLSNRVRFLKQNSVSELSKTGTGSSR
jgi:hypothetical protein